MTRFLSALLLIFAYLASPAQAGTLTFDSYYHNDHLGSPVAATDERGDLLWRAHFRPYGERQEDPKGTAFGTVGYTGHTQSADSGLVYMQARYYDPLIGRFMAVDPVGFRSSPPVSFNRYVYGNNSPYRFTDPDGRQSQDEAWAELGMANPSAGLQHGAAQVGAGASAVGNAVDAVMPHSVGEAILSAGGVGIAGKALGKVANKIARFDGPKPTYHVNPAHVPGQRGFNPAKTPLPKDAEDVFKSAVPNDQKSPSAWFGKNSDGQIYRYSLGNDGTAHFSGINGVGDGVRNFTKYAADRLKEGK